MPDELQAKIQELQERVESREQQRATLNALADRVASLLGVDPESIAIEPPDRISLTVEQLHTIMPVTSSWPVPSHRAEENT